MVFQYEVIIEFEVTVLKSMEPMLRCTDGEYTLFHRAAYVAWRPKRNSWSRSTRSSLQDIFIPNSRSTSICIVFLLFERYSYSLYTLGMKTSWSFSTVLGKLKKTKKFLTNRIEAKRECLVKVKLRHQEILFSIRDEAWWGSKLLPASGSYPHSILFIG